MFHSGQWNAVTGDADMNAGITIGYGQPDEHPEANPTSCALTLEDRNGTYRPLDPSSALYGLIGLGTQFRVGIGNQQSHVALNGVSESYVSTVDHSSLDVTGDIDIRMELTPVTWVPGVLTVLAGKYNPNVNEKSWALRVDATGKPELAWTTDGTSGTRVVSTSTVAVAAGTRAIRVTLEVNNGAAGNDATFYTSTAIDGSWTQLGSVVTTAGATSIFSSTADLTVGALHGGAVEFGSVGEVPLAGRVYAFELRNGIGGTVVAAPDVTALDPGTTTFADTAGRTWTVHDSASIIDVSLRSHTEAIAWTPQVDETTLDVRQDVDSRGILERVGNSDSLKTALRRYIEQNATTPLAYWPLDDDKLSPTGALTLGSGRVATIRKNEVGTDLTLDPTRVFAAGNLGPWITPAAAIRRNSLIEFVLSPATTSSTLWTAHIVMSFDGPYESNMSFDRLYFALHSTTYFSAGDSVSLEFNSTDQTIVVVRPDSSTSSITATETLYDGGPHLVSLRAEQSGSDVVFVVYIDGAVKTGGLQTSLSLTTPRGMVFHNSAATDKLRSISSMVVYSGDGPSKTDLVDAMLGQQGETAGRRIERLCAEEGIPFEHVGDLDATVSMGPQYPVRFLDLVGECQAADLGFVYEPRRSGLGYRTRGSLENQSPALELDMTDGVVVNPFNPPLDATRIVNDVTVSRRDGATAQAVKETGSGSVASVGRRKSGDVTINVESDDQLPDHASWRLNIGTVVGHRLAALEVEMEHHPELQQAVLELRPGDLVRLSSPPPGLPPGPIDLLALGWGDTITDQTWRWTCHCAPASPYHVLQLDSATYSRLDTAGSELAAAINTIDATLKVATTSEPPWTTASGDLPMPIWIGGEQITISGVADTTFTFVSAGAVVHGDNATLNPPLPAGLQDKDLLLLYARIRNYGGAADSPGAGWVTLVDDTYARIFAKVAGSSEPTPQVTFAGVAGNTTSAQVCAFRGSVYDLTKLLVRAARCRNASMQNIPYPGVEVIYPNCVVLYVGGKRDDWTGVTSPGTEIGDSSSTLGNDQGIVWSYQIQTTPTNVPAGSFTVTGGAAEESDGWVLVLRSDLQTFTVSQRAANGVVKSHAVGAAVEIDQSESVVLALGG